MKSARLLCLLSVALIALREILIAWVLASNATREHPIWDRGSALHTPFEPLAYAALAMGVLGAVVWLWDAVAARWDRRATNPAK